MKTRHHVGAEFIRRLRGYVRKEVIIVTQGLTFLYIFNWSDIPTLAFLYTDPGSGALVWQLLVASFVGGLFYIRSFIRRIAAMISGRSSGERRDQQAAVDQPDSTTPTHFKG